MQYAQQYIDGVWRDGQVDKVLVDRNPYTHEIVAKFTSIAGPRDVDDAYRAAARAQTAWAATVNPYRKQVVFDRAISYIEDHIEKITDLIIDELGGTRVKAGFEISLVLDTLREAATLPLRMRGDILPSPIDATENRVYREPVGVVGVISPFNFPLFLSMKAVAPALATGNAVVLKPHEDAPITGGTLIAEIFEAAGLPDGLLNVVVSEVEELGGAFVEHRVPRVIVFTGSAEVGARVAAVAAGRFKQPILELGGNSAFIVLDDAQLGRAVDAAVFSRFTHAGQVCLSANRVLVHRSIYHEFTNLYVAKVRSLPVGDPRDETTVIGPLIHQKQVDTLQSQIEAGISGGARVLLRGEVDGLLVHPTVLADVTQSMRIAHQELFGPVALLMPFDTDTEAVEIANNSPYGLSGAVHTRNLDRGTQLAKHIHTGMVHVNGTTIADEPAVPFGGEKQSGLGRLNGDASLDAFTTWKWISVHRGRRQYPY
jgi:vanillin dehydrogenase